jgi:hypothetical protein
MNRITYVLRIVFGCFSLSYPYRISRDYFNHINTVGEKLILLVTDLSGRKIRSFRSEALAKEPDHITLDVTSLKPG